MKVGLKRSNLQTKEFHFSATIGLYVETTVSSLYNYNGTISKV